MSAPPIVELLRRKCTTANKYGTQGTKPINPDGPDAAELITELYETLERIAANAKQLADDLEQSARSRRTWSICQEDAEIALARARGDQ